MTVKKHNKDRSFNEVWGSEISAYDEECRLREEEFRKHAVILSESGSPELTDEENQVLTLFLNGMSRSEIARQSEVEAEVITGLLEIIKAKLSLND